MKRDSIVELVEEVDKKLLNFSQGIRTVNNVPIVDDETSLAVWAVLTAQLAGKYDLESKMKEGIEMNKRGERFIDKLRSLMAPNNKI